MANLPSDPRGIRLPPDPRRYFTEIGIDEIFGAPLDAWDSRFRTPAPFDHVHPGTTPLAPNLPDLARLHYLVRSRRVTTVLEFGVGRSTWALADALERNRQEFGDFVWSELRRANPFELHSVDTSQHWIDVCRGHLPPQLVERVRFTRTDARMTTFNGRACTLCDTIPNVCPDLIFLDGPDLRSVLGDVHGITTAHDDRLPMSADILVLEPFLLPGTLIVVDGRTANARFLMHNLQGNWACEHHVEEDMHTFELVEPPLGMYNERQLRFCLGDDWPGLAGRKPGSGRASPAGRRPPDGIVTG